MSNLFRQALIANALAIALISQIFIQGFVALASAGVADTGSHYDNPNQAIVTPANNQLAPTVADLPLNQLKQKLATLASANPNLFNPEDVRKFLNDEGSGAANRFLNQRSYNLRRAFGLTKSALKWRKDIELGRLQASDFPCDLFKLGLIFEQGHAHHQTVDGQYVETNPVIWLRLGALGSIVKQLEKFTPARLLSYAYNTPRGVLAKAHNSLRRGRRRVRRQRGITAGVNNVHIQPIIKNLSVHEHETINHVLKAIAWWLNDWVNRNPEDARATLVLDFENTDFAFASWSIGEFLIKLDDLFPDLFDQIIGFRYKPKLWSLHSPISMFNRIFKSRVSSSPETDRKLKFVTTEPQISAYMPRVDAQGYTMLPAHVSGTCQSPEETKAPAGCQNVVAAAGGAGLYDPNLWSAIHNEFYYSCRAKPRSH